MKKILHIEDVYFYLPDDFDGTLGDALMLLANRLVQAEAYKEVYPVKPYNLYGQLKESIRNNKAVISYTYLDENLKRIG